MREVYGYEFTATTKVDLRTMVANFRRWLTTGRLFILPNAGHIIEHTRAAKWDNTRAHLAEHKVYGHFDIFSAAVYLIRYAELIENRNPYPPEHILTALTGAPGTIQERLPWYPKTDADLEIERRVAQGEAELQARMAYAGRLRESPRVRSFR